MAFNGYSMQANHNIVQTIFIWNGINSSKHWIYSVYSSYNYCFSKHNIQINCNMFVSKKKVNHLTKISKIKLQTILIFHAKRLRNNAFELCFMEFEVTFLISYHYCVYLMHYRDNERGDSFQRKITSARIQRVAYIGGW